MFFGQFLSVQDIFWGISVTHNNVQVIDCKTELLIATSGYFF